MGKCSWLLLFLCAACASTPYRYVPAGHPQGEPKNPAVEPTETIFFLSADGKVQVSSLGVVEVEPGKKLGAGWVSAAHVRSIFVNASDWQWILRSQDLVLRFPGRGEVTPLFVNSREAPAELSVPPGGQCSFDLFYPLPDGMESAQDVPEFSFEWTVRMDGRTVSRTGSFRRETVPEPPRVVYPYEPSLWGPFWGPFWWDSPYFLPDTFVFPPPAGPRFYPLPRAVPRYVPLRRYYSR